MLTVYRSRYGFSRLHARFGGIHSDPQPCPTLSEANRTPHLPEKICMTLGPLKAFRGMMKYRILISPVSSWNVHELQDFDWSVRGSLLSIND